MGVPIHLRLRLLIKSPVLSVLHSLKLTTRRAYRDLKRSEKKPNYTPYYPAASPRPYRSNLLSLRVDLPNPPHTDPLVAPLWALNYSSPGFISNHRICHGDECDLWFNRILNKPSEANYLTASMRGSNSN